MKVDSTSDRAISFGVRWRMAPSTSAIMRSRNVLPAEAVIFTTMRSDRTRVPPVTPERSPPASRTTGADSPVMADSSTEAIPATISPSLGMICPASTTTRSPSCNAVETVASMRPPAPFSSPAPARESVGNSMTSGTSSLRRTLKAGVSWRVLRSESACALPRASASASAKLANSTVRTSQRSRAIRYRSVGA